MHARLIIQQKHDELDARLIHPNSQPFMHALLSQLEQN
jgi:hypothetical protein